MLVSVSADGPQASISRRRNLKPANQVKTVNLYIHKRIRNRIVWRRKGLLSLSLFVRGAASSTNVFPPSPPPPEELFTSPPACDSLADRKQCLENTTNGINSHLFAVVSDSSSYRRQVGYF